MKKNISIITIISLFGLLLTTSVAFALEQTSSEEKAAIKPNSVSHITGEEKSIELKDVEKLMPNMSVNLPKFVPEHTKLQDTFYNQPPSSTKGLTTAEINSQKEVKFLYNSDEKGKWFNYIVKESKVSIGDNEKTEIMINNEKAEILEFPDRNIVVISWRTNNEVSHIIESVGFDKDTIVKIAESVQ